MNVIIVKDTVAVYVNAQLTETGTFSDGRFDPTTRLDNAAEVQIEQLPEGFVVGRYTWDGTVLTPMAAVPMIDPDNDQTGSVADKKIAEIDADTSAAIRAGFDYLIDGTVYHFSYDEFDQQNFSDSANVVNLLQAGVEGLPESTPWNAYKNWTPETGGELVQLTLGAESFIQIYTSGALTHKAACMAAGIARKNAVKAALVAKATAAEIQAI